MNELLLVVTAFLSALLVLVGWKLGKERLYSVIIVFLILIAVVGGKIVPFFGYETNTGNIFYASVFLATYFLIERFGRREGIYSIWVGVITVLFFSALAQITVAFTGSEKTAPLNHALAIAFSPVSRITFASLCAYTLSQSLNVYVYLLLKKRTQRMYLWLRANICNALAQLLDSAVFFTIAFLGVVPFSSVSGIIFTGLIIKIVYMMFVSPLLYLNKREEEEDAKGVTVVTLRY